MLKNMLICLVCCLTYGDAIGEDIFGLKKGMTVEEIRALGFWTLLGPSGTDDDYFGVVNPKMPKDGLLRVSFEWSTYEGKNSVDTLKQYFGQN